jgi:membrane protein DedA with SNARE-associated domain
VSAAASVLVAVTTVGGLLSAAAADGGSSWINDVVLWLLDLVQSVDPVVRTLLAGLGIMLETSILIGLVIPGDTIVIVASTAVDGWVEYVALILAVVAGALIGESVGFGLGRFFGPRIRASALGRRIGERNWIRAENYLDRRGGIAVFISRFLPVLHSVIPLTVGMSTMSYRKFLAWTIPATTIWTVAYVSVGAFAAGSFRDLLNQLHYAGYIFVGVIAVFIIITLVVKKLLERAEARHMDRPGDGDANTIDDPL